MKVYRHYQLRVFLLPLVIVGLACVGILAGFAWLLSTRGGSAPPPPVIFLLPIAALAPHLWILGSTAFEIRLGDDGTLDFVSVLRRAQVPVADVRSIAPSSSYPPNYVARCARRKLRFDGRLNGLHELVAEIKRRNPSVELRGI